MPLTYVFVTFIVQFNMIDRIRVFTKFSIVTWAYRPTFLRGGRSVIFPNNAKPTFLRIAEIAVGATQSRQNGDNYPRPSLFDKQSQCQLS